MVDLHIGNFVTIGLISILSWISFEWAISFMGWTMPHA